MKLSKSQLAVLFLIAANMIWGAAPPIFKWALDDIHPFTLAFLRFALPALIMFPFVRNKLWVHPKDRFKLVILGFLGITVNITFFFLGLMQAPSINAALIGSSAPIFIVFYSLLFLREKPRKNLVVGSLVGLLGVTLVLIFPFFKNGSIAAIGNLYYVFAMLAAAISIVLVRQVMKRNNAATITFWSFVIGSVGFIPMFAKEVEQFGFLNDLSFQGLIGLLFGVFLSTLAAYLMQTYALKYLTAADVSVFAYMDPVVTILIAAPLLGEFPDTAFVIGSVLVIWGIFQSEGRFHWHPLHLFLKK